ncbi:MAG: HIT family protein [Deltaproteobacteria bacterium]|nr:HIT family protein [Deltaproteobacteria bacterium]
MSTETCIFCDIVAGKVPAFKVYEDERSLAFADINPVTPGHTLVIPKNHTANLWEITPGDLAGVHQAAQKVARAMKAALKPAGIFLAQLNGEAAGQIIMHYHVHLIPRNPGDPLAAMHWEAKPGDMGEIQKLAIKIAEAI